MLIMWWCRPIRGSATFRHSLTLSASPLDDFLCFQCLACHVLSHLHPLMLLEFEQSLLHFLFDLFQSQLGVCNLWCHLWFVATEPQRWQSRKKMTTLNSLEHWITLFFPRFTLDAAHRRVYLVHEDFDVNWLPWTVGAKCVTCPSNSFQGQIKRKCDHTCLSWPKTPLAVKSSHNLIFLPPMPLHVNAVFCRERNVGWKPCFLWNPASAWQLGKMTVTKFMLHPGT